MGSVGTWGDAPGPGAEGPGGPFGPGRTKAPIGVTAPIGAFAAPASVDPSVRRRPVRRPDLDSLPRRSGHVPKVVRPADSGAPVPGADDCGQRPRSRSDGTEHPTDVWTGAPAPARPVSKAPCTGSPPTGTPNIHRRSPLSRARARTRPRRPGPSVPPRADRPRSGGTKARRGRPPPDRPSPARAGPAATARRRSLPRRTAFHGDERTDTLPETRSSSRHAARPPPARRDALPRQEARMRRSPVASDHHSRGRSAGRKARTEVCRRGRA